MKPKLVIPRKRTALIKQHEQELDAALTRVREDYRAGTRSPQRVHVEVTSTYTRLQLSEKMQGMIQYQHIYRATFSTEAEAAAYMRRVKHLCDAGTTAVIVRE